MEFQSHVNVSTVADEHAFDNGSQAPAWAKAVEKMQVTYSNPIISLDDNACQCNQHRFLYPVRCLHDPIYRVDIFHHPF
jgi:hypothetical protein